MKLSRSHRFWAQGWTRCNESHLHALLQLCQPGPSTFTGLLLTRPEEAAGGDASTLPLGRLRAWLQRAVAEYEQQLAQLVAVCAREPEPGTEAEAVAAWKQQKDLATFNEDIAKCAAHADACTDCPQG